MQPSDDTCIGMIEIDAVPTGLRAADALVKAAPVRVLLARPVTPSKYLVLCESEVEAVQIAVRAGVDVAGARAIGQLVLPDAHPQLREGLGKVRKVEATDAVGIVETETVAAAIVAADAALKEGEVDLIELRLAMGLGGRAFFTVTGEVSSVECALEKATDAASRQGALRDAAVIANPDRDVLPHIVDPQPPFADLG